MFRFRKFFVVLFAKGWILYYKFLEKIRPKCFLKPNILGASFLNIYWVRKIQSAKFLLLNKVHCTKYTSRCLKFNDVVKKPFLLKSFREKRSLPYAWDPMLFWKTVIFKKDTFKELCWKNEFTIAFLWPVNTHGRNCFIFWTEYTLAVISLPPTRTNLKQIFLIYHQLM